MGPLGNWGIGEGGEKLQLLGLSWRSKQIELQDGMQVWETEVRDGSFTFGSKPTLLSRSLLRPPLHKQSPPLVCLSLLSPMLPPFSTQQTCHLQLQSFCAPVPPSSLHFNSRLCLTHFLISMLEVGLPLKSHKPNLSFRLVRVTSPELPSGPGPA